MDLRCHEVNVRPWLQVAAECTGVSHLVLSPGIANILQGPRYPVLERAHIRGTLVNVCLIDMIDPGRDQLVVTTIYSVVFRRNVNRISLARTRADETLWGAKILSYDYSDIMIHVSDMRIWRLFRLPRGMMPQGQLPRAAPAAVMRENSSFKGHWASEATR
ncbi:hypothetical protein H4582DRAFT_2020909 [Lactarius indigo]|nr:hypothetical protein H4582DRAFT_2020909 [Lactarius indigo]